MAITLTTEALQDPIAVSLARIMAVANKRARELGVDVEHSLITITRHFCDGSILWRINYGPKDYIGRRGGDLTIEVDSDETIKRVLWGQ